MKGQLSSGVSTVSEKVEKAGEAQKASQAAPPAPEPPKPQESAPAAPEPVQVEQAAPEVDLPESSFFTHETEDEPILTPEAPAKSDEVSEQETAEAKRTLRKIKAGGALHEVDFSDIEALEDHVKKSIGSRKAHTKADRLDKENAKLLAEIKELKKYQSAMEYLEEVKDDDAELFKRMTGGRTLDTAFERHQKHQTWLATAPEAEIEAWKLSQRVQSLESESKAAVEKQKAAEARAREIERSTARSSLKSELLQELSRVSFAGTLGDKVEEESLDNMIYTTATTDLKLYAKKYKEETGEDLKEISPEVRRKAFDRVKALLSHRSKEVAEEQLTAISAKRSEEAAKKAAVASTKNYRKPLDSKLERQIARRPTMLFKGRLK